MMARHARGFLTVLLVACSVLSACGPEPESIADAADILIHNAKIYTVDESNLWAQAAAIRNGRFVYVGSDAGVHAFHGSDTRSFDLAGKMVLPGLIDSHTHPGSIAIKGNEDTSKNLPYPASKAEILAWVADYAAANPKPDLILTGHWQVDVFGIEGPRKEDLDAVVPDRPVVVLDDSGHSKWVNSAFLKMIGVDANTPDEVPGVSLNRESIDLHLHTNSDGAARIALDAVAGARERAGGKLDTRVALCHLELLHEDDFARSRELGVIANFTLHWNGIGYLSSWGPSIGPERTAQRFRIRPLIDDGAIVTYSSDETTIAGLARTSPFFSMQIGHNRQEVGAAPDSEILAPIGERLDLADIVDGYTKAGAYQLRAEGDLGTIEFGKLADLIVLNENLFAADRYEIHKIAPTAVLLAGELVWGSLP